MKSMEDSPKIHIVNADQLHFELLSFCLKNELNAQCVLYAEPPPGDFKSMETGEGNLWLMDCLELETAGLKKCFDTLFATQPKDLLIALFNVDPECRLESFIRQNRIRGVFFKNDSCPVFLKGIRTILDGRLWLSRKVMSDCLRQPRENFQCPMLENRNFLSIREKVILQIMTSGASNQEIADELRISVHTVKTHLYKIYRKINVLNRSQAALWANAYSWGSE